MRMRQRVVNDDAIFPWSSSWLVVLRCLKEGLFMGRRPYECLLKA